MEHHPELVDPGRSPDQGELYCQTFHASFDRLRIKLSMALVL